MPHVRFQVPFLGPESQLKSGFACAGLLCSTVVRWVRYGGYAGYGTVYAGSGTGYGGYGTMVRWVRYDGTVGAVQWVRWVRTSVPYLEGRR